MNWAGPDAVLRRRAEGRWEGGVLLHRRHIHGNEAERPPSPALQTALWEKAVPCVTQGGGMRTAAEEGVDEG